MARPVGVCGVGEEKAHARAAQLGETIDEATVYNELLELLYLDKTQLKRASTGGKLDAVADAASKFNDSYELIAYAEGLKVMGPVRNRNANRPV